jgi:hypothetical protein
VRRTGAGLVAAAVVAFVVAALAGCSGLVEGRPTPTPVDFGGIAATLASKGIPISNPTSGDAGCSDATLIPAAIRFDATGPDLAVPVRLRIYIFRDQAAWERRRADVDRCIAAWATDLATFETVDAPPYVLAGQGPWPAAFKTAVAAALQAASGAGG